MGAASGAHNLELPTGRSQYLNDTYVTNLGPKDVETFVPPLTLNLTRTQEHMTTLHKSEGKKGVFMCLLSCASSVLVPVVLAWTPGSLLVPLWWLSHGQLQYQELNMCF